MAEINHEASNCRQGSLIAQCFIYTTVMSYLLLIMVLISVASIFTCMLHNSDDIVFVGRLYFP